RRLEVGSAGARLGEDTALSIGEKTDGLGPASIDTQHVQHGPMVQCCFPLMDLRFRSARVRRAVRLVTCVLLTLVAAGVFALRLQAADPSGRAAWVPASLLDGPDGVRRAIAAAVAAGVNTIVAPAPLYTESGPDRFQELLRLAHERQLLVHASFD